jgi:hypothetical protein
VQRNLVPSWSYRAGSQHCGNTASGHDPACSNHGHVGLRADLLEERQQGAVVGGEIGETALVAADLAALHDEQVRAHGCCEHGFEHGCHGDRYLDSSPVQPLDDLRGRAPEGEG